MMAWLRADISTLITTPVPHSHRGNADANWGSLYTARPPEISNAPLRIEFGVRLLELQIGSPQHFYCAREYGTMGKSE